MLRLCLTLSVLLGQQVAETSPNVFVEKECMSTICGPIMNDIPHNGYEEEDTSNLKWLLTFINGTDLETATDIALDRFFNYSRFNNAADTIVPISAPWGMTAPIENSKIKPEFYFYVSLPVEVQTPPEPRDPSVHITIASLGTFYVRTIEQKTEDYGQLVNEFKKDLENDQRPFDSSDVHIAWFNTSGLFQIVFDKK